MITSEILESILRHFDYTVNASHVWHGESKVQLTLDFDSKADAVAFNSYLYEEGVHLASHRCPKCGTSLMPIVKPDNKKPPE